MQITPGAHSSEAAVNKQLNDKERVAAALENPNLLGMVNKYVADMCHMHLPAQHMFGPLRFRFIGLASQIGIHPKSMTFLACRCLQSAEAL